MRTFISVDLFYQPTVWSSFSYCVSQKYLYHRSYYRSPIEDHLIANVIV